MVSGGIQFHYMPISIAVQAVLRALSARRAAAGRQLRLQRSLQGRQPARAGHGRDHAGLPSRRARSASASASRTSRTSAASCRARRARAAREIYHDGIVLPAGAVPDRAPASTRRSRRSSPTTAASPRSCSAICARRSARRGIGGERLAALCDEYGRDTVLEVMDEPDAAHRAPRREPSSRPGRDGEAEAEGFLDHDGAAKDQPVRIHVRAHQAGDRCDSISPARRRRPLGRSISSSSTARAVSLLALLAAADPTIPVNSGLHDAVEFVIPEGLVVNPRHPATINHYFPTAHLVYNVVLAALGPAQPDARGGAVGARLAARSRSAIARRAAASPRCSTSCSIPRSAAPARMTARRS